MVRFFIAFCLTLSFLNAQNDFDEGMTHQDSSSQFIDLSHEEKPKKNDKLEATIVSFMDNKTYQESKNLVQFLFLEKSNYYTSSGKINKLAILETLKTNGLIELFSKKPEEIELIFSTKDNPLVFMRIISQSLNSMGYSFFLTKRVYKTPVEFIWHISIQTQNIPNPIDLNENLKLNSSFIEDIAKDGNIWSYEINSENAVINSQIIPKKIQVELKKPMNPYWIRVDGASSISFKSHLADFWFPKASFFDKNLKLIERIEIDSRKKSLKLAVPKNAFYIKVEDLYLLENIKRGLSVTLL